MSNISVHYINHMGNDNSVVNAARLSTNTVKTFNKQKDEALIKYLAMGQSSKETKRDINYLASGEATEKEIIKILMSYKNKSTHWTPFAHTCISLRCKAPIPIRTQAFKHKQGLVENEESRRYISDKPEIYIPDSFRTKAKNIKQGSGNVHKNNEDLIIPLYTNITRQCIETYEEMISIGVAPEQARFILPQGVMVNWQWTGNLYAFANFYNSRTDSHAQKEIQELAYKIGDIIKPLFPMSWLALTSKE